MSYKGTVRNGVVVLPPEAHLPEGATVDIIAEESPPEEVLHGKHGAVDSLDALFSASRRPGWDGYDAKAVSHESYLHAKRFIQGLPGTFPTPEVALDPDGEISLEWYRSPGRVFSVSVGANHQLTYAGKFSAREKAHGTEPFTEQIPTVILDNLRRLLT